MSDDLVAAVRALAAEVRELRAALAPELEARARLLAALNTTFRHSVFTSLDALEAAAQAPAGELGRAVVDIVGPVPAGGLRRLARRLAKMAGKPASGFVLRRIGEDRGSALYAVASVTQTAQSTASPATATSEPGTVRRSQPKAVTL